MIPQHCAGDKLRLLFYNISEHQHITQTMWVWLYLLASALWEPVHPESQFDLNEYVSPDRANDSAVMVNPFLDQVDFYHEGNFTHTWHPQSGKASKNTATFTSVLIKKWLFAQSLALTANQGQLGPLKLLDPQTPITSAMQSNQRAISSPLHPNCTVFRTS